MLRRMGEPSAGGPPPPTIFEVARRAGVSIATVSRVASGTGRVRDATRLRVEQAIAATGWAPDPAARLLAGGRGEQVALAVAVPAPGDFAADPHYARVVAGAQQQAAQLGLFLSVHVAALGGIAGLAPFGRKPRSAGAILVNATPGEAAQIHARGWPVVSMGVTAPGLPAVDPDNQGGAGDAVRHLIAQGRRRIAVVTGPSRNPCALERRAGYASALRSAGRPEIVASADFTRPGAVTAARRLLATRPDVDAVFVASDLMAAGVLQELQAQGRRVPDDVAVVGFDDSLPAQLTTPVLSTVHHPVEQLAALAVRTLAAAADHPLDQRLPTRLVLRASSAALPTAA
jgi:DNA-binding LacI/PurR family transcriptional regulator